MFLKCRAGLLTTGQSCSALAALWLLRVVPVLGCLRVSRFHCAGSKVGYISSAAFHPRGQQRYRPLLRKALYKGHNPRQQCPISRRASCLSKPLQPDHRAGACLLPALTT
jgi:hypothetical protein